jgi:capsule biosynthesis phosphatase
MKKKVDKYVIDIDNTISQTSFGVDYDNRIPIHKNLNVLKEILKKNNACLFTSRGMLTYKNNVKEITKNHSLRLTKWLKSHGIRDIKIFFGKPYCGENGFYVDDRALYLDDFRARVQGPMSKYAFDIIVPFYNEEKLVEICFEMLIKLEKIVHINKFILINNGSSDRTLDILNYLSNTNKKIQIINIKKNIGYGTAIKKGLEKSKTKYFFIVHGDCQFDPYEFLLINKYFIKFSKVISNNIFSILPKRINRPLISRIKSFLLRILVSTILLKKVPDFNGQPKILSRRIVGSIRKMPNNFLIDLYFTLKALKHNYIIAPVIEHDRMYGMSSWNFSIKNNIKLFFSYIKFALKIR